MVNIMAMLLLIINIKYMAFRQHKMLGHNRRIRKKEICSFKSYLSGGTKLDMRWSPHSGESMTWCCYFAIGRPDNGSQASTSLLKCMPRTENE